MVDASLARSFELIGEDYDRFRPGFPEEAVDIMIPERVEVALDLGAGTGKLTALLQDRADRVVAVEPSVAMLDVLRSALPDVEALIGSAEQIPLPDGSTDVVTVAQAFHWFDRPSACAEIARVLRTEGTLGLVWNRHDPTCSWDRAAHRVAHPAVADSDGTTTSAVEELPGFHFVERRQISWAERISREVYLGRWATVSSFLVADAETRAVMFSAIEAILAGDPQTAGRGEFELPIITDVFVYRRA